MDFAAHDIGVASTRFQRAMTQVVAVALQDAGLTPGEYGVLDHVKRHPGVSNAELARYLLITPQALGRLARRLADVGLIVSQVDGPGRRQPVTLTEAGTALYAASRIVVNDALQALFSNLDDGERRSLHRMLTAVTDSAM